ncbi:MAG TPA: aldose 1-epimerase [Firmicutes bacterium]|nr:aldose 1-epimerase [Bacillota bacterium]
MAGYLIREILFDSEKAYELVDDSAGLVATLIPGLGSNLISLRSTKRGIDFIRGPEIMAQLRERPVGFGFPVLMPPSRIADGSFEFMGRRYTFVKNEGGKNHIHGLVYDRPWKVTKACADDNGGAFIQTRISSDEHPEIMRSLPHSFDLELSFRLKDGLLAIEATATNKGPDPMPFGLGFHPYFRVPLTSDSSKASCFIKLPAGKRWEMLDLLPTGRILPVEGKYDLRPGRSLENLILDDVFTDVEAGPGPRDSMVRCEYRDEKAGAGVIFEAGAEFPHWVVYTGRTPDTDFVCLEPYTWIPNAPNLNMPAELTGTRALMQGEPFKGRMILRPYW